MARRVTLVWSRARVAHVWKRHRLTQDEVEEATFGDPLVRRTRQGRWLIYGQTEAGRYLTVIAFPIAPGRLFVITAREMTTRERRYYQRRGK